MKLPKGLSVTHIGPYKVAKLYNTNIVEIDNNNNSLILRTGGWETRHTKKCMNLVLSDLGLGVIQRDFKWLVTKNNEVIGQFINNAYVGML